MANERVEKPASWLPQIQAKTSQFAVRPFADQPQTRTQQEIEPQAFSNNQPSGTKMLEIPNFFGPRTPASPPPIQTKLTIGEPGDRYEQEADRTAEQVVSKINAPPPSPQTVQREENPEQEEDKLMMKPESGTLQRKENAQRSSTKMLEITNFFGPRTPASPAPIQTKLTLGVPGERYEQEADRVAREGNPQQEEDKLMKAEEGEDKIMTKPISSILQRDMKAEEGEDKIMTKPISGILQRDMKAEEGEDKIMTKPISGILQRQEALGGAAATPDIESSIQQARGSGQPLADSIRQPMENAFGADFSGVKVHTDSQSDQLNRSIQAKAFTTGQDVFFRQGAYDPGSKGGQELIAHELTHVVQQNGNSVARKLNSKNINSLQPKRITQPALKSEFKVVQRNQAPEQGQGAEQAKQALKGEFAQDAEANDLKQKLQSVNQEKQKAENLKEQLKSAAAKAGVEAPDLGELGEAPDAKQVLQELNTAPDKLTADIGKSDGGGQAQPVMRKAETSGVGQVSLTSNQPVIQRWGWSSIKKGFQQIGGAIASGAKAVGGAVVSGAEAVGGAVVSGAEAVGGAVVSGANWIGEKATQGWNALKEGAKSAWNSVKSAASQAWNAVSTWVAKAFAIATAWIKKQIAKAKQKLMEVVMKATGMKEKMGLLLQETNEKLGLTKRLNDTTQFAKEKIKGVGTTLSNIDWAKVGVAFAEGAGKAFAGPLRPGWWTDKADEYKNLWSEKNKAAYGEGRLGDAMRVVKTLDKTLGNVGELVGWVSLIAGIAAPLVALTGIGATVSPVLLTISAIAAKISIIIGVIRLVLNAILAIHNKLRLKNAKPEEKEAIQKTLTGDLTDGLLSAVGAAAAGYSHFKASGSGFQGALDKSVQEAGTSLIKQSVVSTTNAAIGGGIGGAAGAAGEVSKQLEKEKEKKSNADTPQLISKKAESDSMNNGISAQLQQAILSAVQSMEMTNQQAQTQQDEEINSLSQMKNKAQETQTENEKIEQEAGKGSTVEV